MKAAIFEKPGLENLKIKQDIEEPKITDVLIKVLNDFRMKTFILFYLMS
jgi:hypothetical protein